MPLRRLRAWARAGAKTASSCAVVLLHRLGRVLRPKDTLLRDAEIRYQGLWIGPAPALLDPSRLGEACLLFCGRRKKTLVTHMTSSPLSHCGVVIRVNGTMSVLEAMPFGGVKLNRIEDFIARYDYLCVLRIAPDATGLARARAFAESFGVRTGGYAFLKALLLPLREYLHQWRSWRAGAVPDLRERPPGRRKAVYTCSELLLEFCREAGMDGLDRAYFDPVLWTPARIVEEGPFAFAGYVAPSYDAIHPGDPTLQGCGYMLSTWEAARKAALARGRGPRTGRPGRRNRPWK